MDIKKFLEQTGGQWFSQRTTYNLEPKETKVENSKADLTVEILAPDDPQIINLCQENSFDPSLILGAIASSWNNSLDWGKPKQQGSSLLALVKNEENEQKGKIFRAINQAERKVIVGNYILGKDEALTLILQQGNNYAEERIWFASSNLRMRTIIQKNNHKCTMSSFYSEIRKVTKAQ
jgi:hypothetical protein